jgi:hypothetical protein
VLAKRWRDCSLMIPVPIQARGRERRVGAARRLMGKRSTSTNAAYSDGHLLREWLVCATTGHQVPSRNQTLIHYQGNYRLASYPDIRIGTI